jgi:hypothetical protein
MEIVGVSYLDNKGSFTDLMISTGRLEMEWESTTPEYYIDVSSSLSDNNKKCYT